ncbi:hypothetical protein E4T43_08001 [Aureobasidium subglaciale]|nr:hypothetical protein E4T43_08001 [Aureobasidium subglaciale]
MSSFSESNSKIRLCIATSICLLFMISLYEAWKHDLISGGLDSEALSIGQTYTDYGALLFGGMEEDTGSVSDEESAVSKYVRPAIIAGTVAAESLSWMQNMTGSFEVFQFVVTDFNAPPNLAVPANKGREAMVYLSYIIHNYDKLPPYAIFTHGHRTAWHQERDIVQMIHDLKTDALEQARYVSLRFSWSPSCPAELRPKHHDAVVWGDGDHLRETENAIGDAWPILFPNEDLPETIASQCCAQFAVTKQAIRRRTKADYTRMRGWLLETPLDDSVSGRVFEKLWAYVFLGEAVQ